MSRLPNIPKRTFAQLNDKIKKDREEKKKYKGVLNRSWLNFWEMPEDSQMTVRFLPDLNPENQFFYRSVFSHGLDIDGKFYRITCPKTFGNTNDCPICDRSQEFYAQKDKERGYYYWKRETRLARVLVIDPGKFSVEDEEGNPFDFKGRTCTTRLSKQVFTALEESTADIGSEYPDIDPTGIEEGFNFIIKKKSAGDGNFSYTYSRFETTPSAVPEEFMDNLDFVDFDEIMPQQQSVEKLSHFLAAHDGLVDFNHGRVPGEDDDDSVDQDDSDDDRPAPPARKPQSNPLPDKVEESSTTASSDNDDVDDGVDEEDMDFINDILNRKKNAG